MWRNRVIRERFLSAMNVAWFSVREAEKDVKDPVRTARRKHEGSACSAKE